jgi:hypothetical protein
LLECKKPQNLSLDLHVGVEVFLAQGIAVSGGMIVGFDHDREDIFERQYKFAMSSPIPVFSLGALVAPAATALHARLAAAQRLIEDGPEVAALPWDTNALYRPSNFMVRMARMIEKLGPHPLLAARTQRPRAVETDAMLIAKRLASLGSDEGQLVRSTLRAIGPKPHAARAAMTALFRYAQIRCMYEQGGFWEPHPDCDWSGSLPLQNAAALPGSGAMAHGLPIEVSHGSDTPSRH